LHAKAGDKGKQSEQLCIIAVRFMKLLRQTWREKLVYLFSMLMSRIINGRKNLRQIKPKHILCIRQDEIGDMCYSLHVFDMLKKQFPDAKLTLLCKPFAITLLNNNPNIDHLTSNWNDLINRYDLIVDLRGSWRSIIFSVTHWPKVRLDRATVRYHNMKAGKHPHEVITNLQVVAPVIAPENQHTVPKIYTSKSDEKKTDDFLIDTNVGKYAVLHTGARKALRKWKQYAALAEYLKKEKQLDIIFTGDKSEMVEIMNIQKQIGFETFSVAGFFNLTELAELIRKADLYVGNESGPLHIAAVTGTPCLGIYGPGEPYVFYPWGEKTAVVHHVLECNPCDQVHCVHPENPCIDRVSLIEVIEKIETLLS
jgi:ADP-heptose:LPS heptosyltransferase